MNLESCRIQNQYTEVTCILYPNNAKSEREIKESIPFTIATKRIKYLGRNLPKKPKELYTENYKTLMKEVKDDINRWRDIPCSWIGKINPMKMTILPNATYRFNAITIQLPLNYHSMNYHSNYQWHFSQN